MAKPRLIMALAKVLIAAAWSDGRITNDEINSLKDLLFHLPGMTAREWVQLEIYIATPVDAEERARLVGELQAALRKPRDKALALAALDDLLQADGEMTGAERQVFDEIRGALDQVDVSILGQLGGLLSGPVSRRSEATTGAPNREERLDDFVKNRIFYALSRRLEMDAEDLDLPEKLLRKLSLAGGLMARVAYVDRDVTGGEFDAMVDALARGWDVEPQEAALVAEVAVSQIGKDLDYYRLTRQFYEVTSEREREDFLNVLFAVAAGDGQVSHEEMEEIRTISKVLKLTHKQYIHAKLKIPRDERAY